MSTKCVLIICSVIAVIAIYSPARHARHYDYIDIEDIYDELVFSRSENAKPNLKNCDYEEAILNNREIEIESINKPNEFYKPGQGGEYVPKNCNPLMKIAVIVPYRNRSQQLNLFLNYMHNFLQKQNLEYRIFIVNQMDVLPFNRAKMLNYGAKVAMDMGYPCLILHDVDLLPLNSGNIYSCGKKPRHMSSSLDTFRFNLPYLTLFGGAVAISSDHFQRINGMSNQFTGWGGEDDDFYSRLEIHNLLPYRFSPELSKYTMLPHKKQKARQVPERYAHMKMSLERHRLDGLSSLPVNYTVKLEDLYTLVMAS
ncbi:beta-1,4-galactosyltransferase 1 [Asbolus verrucosus]|uniref:Beta-1,4-N-acetylgalactosaminyltransferase n=1 Tax=Asbolus verrucosus TaxID=1661398 RepID=A0A482V979_ASBVE|nr:beta-1,4-galactosyltransferase 1 [Asbolus verrucosus]